MNNKLNKHQKSNGLLEKFANTQQSFGFRV